MFTKWLQDTFDCPLVIQLSDEEKYAFNKGTFKELHKMGWENSRDIAAVGFNPAKTFIFSNRDYRIACPKYETFVCDMKVNASVKEVAKVFGFNEDGNVGMYDWPFYQSAASFSQAFPHIFGGRPAHCLIPCAIDQDPYFRLGRDLAQRMNLLKTSTLYCSFLPPLQGLDGGKIGKESTLFLTDSGDIIKKKILKYSKSGSRGDGSMNDHKRLGGDVNEDIACQYLKYFEMDDEILKSNYELFGKGELSCKDMKDKLVEKLYAKFNEVSENRKLVSDEKLSEFYKIKPIELPKVKAKAKTEEQVEVEKFLEENKVEYTTTYHNPPVLEEELSQVRLKLEGTLCKVYLLYSQEKYFMAIYDFDTPFAQDKLKFIEKQMGLKKLKLATKDTVKEFLKCDLTYTSLFGLLFDKEKKISEVWIDEKINPDEKVNFSPIRIDSRITISFQNMIRLLTENFKVEIKYFTTNKK